MLILHNFLSFYFQALMYNFIVYITLINSFTLKVSKRKAYVVAFICSNFIPITDALAQVYVGGGVVPYTVEVYWILKACNMIGQVLAVLYIVFVFSDRWYKCYWWAILAQTFAALSMACGYGFHFIYSVNDMHYIRAINSKTLAEYVLYLVITFFVGCILVFIGRRIRKIKILGKISIWYWYCIYLVWAIVTFNSDKSYGSVDQISVLSRMSNLNKIIIFFIIQFIILFISTNRYDKKLLKMEINLLKQQNEIQYENYLTMQQQEMEIHKLYHDIGNHIETIKILLNEGDNQEAREYTNELTKKYKDTRKYYSNNKIINAVLSQKLKLCEQKDITYNYDLRIPDNLLIKDVDLMSVFSNLLDNAIECQRNSSDNKYIEIKVMPIGNYLTVKIINSKPTKIEPDIEKNSFKTWKNDKSLHGYGLKIIEEIVHRYDGKTEFKNNMDSFSAMVMLKMEIQLLP